MLRHSPTQMPYFPANRGSPAEHAEIAEKGYLSPRLRVSAVNMVLSAGDGASLFNIEPFVIPKLRRFGDESHFLIEALRRDVASLRHDFRPGGASLSEKREGGAD